MGKSTDTTGKVDGRLAVGRKQTEAGDLPVCSKAVRWEACVPACVALGVVECSLNDSTQCTHTACGQHRMRESMMRASQAMRGEHAHKKRTREPSDVATPPPPCGE